MELFGEHAMLLKEIFDSVLTELVGPTFSTPQAKDTYQLAKEFDLFANFTIVEWTRTIAKGKQTYFSKVKDVEHFKVHDKESADASWLIVTVAARKRFADSRGPYEMPIIVRVKGKPFLISGEGTLTGCLVKNIDPIVWVIDMV